MLLNVPMGGCGGVILLKVPLQNHMKTPPLAHGELQILSYTRHSDYLSREGSFSFQHQLRHGTSVHTLSSEGLVSTSHSGIPTRDVRIKYLLRDSRGDALTIKYTFKEWIQKFRANDFLLHQIIALTTVLFDRAKIFQVN